MMPNGRLSPTRSVAISGDWGMTDHSDPPRARIAEAFQNARNEGYRQGLEEGQRQGREELLAEVARWDQPLARDIRRHLGIEEKG